MTHLLAAVLLEVVQQTTRVGEPECDGLGVVLPLLDDLPDVGDGVAEQRLHLAVVVHVVSVADAHEEDVRRKTRDVRRRLPRFQV